MSMRRTVSNEDVICDRWYEGKDAERLRVPRESLGARFIPIGSAARVPLDSHLKDYVGPALL